MRDLTDKCMFLTAFMLGKQGNVPVQAVSAASSSPPAIVGFTGTFAKRAGHFSRGGQTFTQGITS